MDLLDAALTLAQVEGVGDTLIGSALLRLAGGAGARPDTLAEALCSAGGSPESIGALASLTDGARARVAADLRVLRTAGVLVAAIGIAPYPERLAARRQAPQAVYMLGNPAVLAGRTVASAVSNGAPASVLDAMDAWLACAAARGATVVTGHNREAYRRAALAGLRMGGRVAYVLDRGLIDAFDPQLRRSLFPSARIWSPDFRPDSDLALTPWRPRCSAMGDRNRQRDALVLGLADTVLVGWVRDGGVMQQCSEVALAEGRRVVLVGPRCESWRPLIESGAEQARDRSPGDLLEP